MKSTARYADKETLQLIESEWNKGQDAGKAASAKVDSEGKIWTEGRDVRVSVLEREGPMRSSFVEVIGNTKGLKAARFWVGFLGVVPMSSPSAKRLLAEPASEPDSWTLDKSNTVNKADFAHVLEGHEVTIGSVIIGNFVELVAGLYEGAISDASARKCLAMRESIGGVTPCDLQRVVGQRLIYEGVFSVHEHFLFGLVREPAFEKGNANPARMYEEIRHSSSDNRNPLFKGALVYTGMEDFTTEGGFVRQIPVFKVVNVQP